MAETWFSILRLTLRDPQKFMQHVEGTVVIIKESLSIDRAIDFALEFEARRNLCWAVYHSFDHN